jgi:thymidylate synthase
MRDIIRGRSCTDGWLQAVEHLKTQNDWRDYNLVLEIANPMSLSKPEREIAAEVNRFLTAHAKYPISTVINTIFPASIYAKHGADGVFNLYGDIFPTLRDHPDNKRGWGTYFMRMLRKTDQAGHEVRPLEYLIEKLRGQAHGRGPKRAVYELNFIEPLLDIPLYDATTDKHYHMGGPCLSHLSFKLKGDKSLVLTALYRSHYYVQRALGNFYGLALLQDFVARQAGVDAAELVCHSTMAVLDTENMKESEVSKMLDSCRRLRQPLAVST